MRRFNLAHAHVSTFQRGVSRVIISKISKQLSSSLWKASSPIRQPLSPAAFASVPRAVSTISFSLPHPLLRPFLHQPPPALCLLPLASLKKIGENLKRLAPSIGLQGVEERERERGEGWPLSECLSCVRGLRWIPLDDQRTAAHRCTHSKDTTKYTLTQSPPTTTFPLPFPLISPTTYATTPHGVTTC